MLEPLKKLVLNEAPEIPLGAPTYALYLHMRDDANDNDALKDWILRARSDVAQVYFEHPNID
jgi:hypothetical protein